MLSYETFDGKVAKGWVELELKGFPRRIYYTTLSKHESDGLTAEVKVRTKIPKDQQVAVGSYLSRLFCYNKINIEYNV